MPTPLPTLDARTTSPVLREAVRELDLGPDDPARAALLALLPRFTGTAGDGLDAERSRRALDWFVRTFVPACVELVGAASGARKLQRLPAITHRTSAENAAELLAKVLGQVESDARKVSEALRSPLEGGALPEAAGTAWNDAVDQLEAVGRTGGLHALEGAAVRAARAAGEERAAWAGWNTAVSLADMAVQAFLWQTGQEEVASAVAAATQGRPWTVDVERARARAREALTPVEQALARSWVELLEQLVRPV